MKLESLKNNQKFVKIDDLGLSAIYGGEATPGGTTLLKVTYEQRAFDTANGHGVEWRTVRVCHYRSWTSDDGSCYSGESYYSI